MTLPNIIINLYGNEQFAKSFEPSSLMRYKKQAKSYISDIEMGKLKPQGIALPSWKMTTRAGTSFQGTLTPYSVQCLLFCTVLLLKLHC